MRTKYNFLWVLTLAVTVIVGCKKTGKEKAHDGYYIYGTVEGLDEGTVTSHQDTAKVTDGHFVLKGKVDGAEQRIFTINGTYMFGLLLGNETFEIDINPAQADERNFIAEIGIRGSVINDEEKKVSGHIASLPESKKLQELFQKGKTMEKGTEEYNKNYEEVSEAREAARKVRTAYIKNYALNNPGSVIAARYMNMQANEVDQTYGEFKQIVEGFSDEVKRSVFYRSLKDELDALQRTAIGEVAPDFTLKTDKGEDFTLSSLRGEKIVLVDFWASWCVPCRKSYPHLKEVYDKYKNSGFEIVGVTNDSNHDSWKKAIKEDGLQWIQVADVFPPRDAGPPYTAKVITEYAAPYLPSTYLLDKEGRILAKYVHGDELDKKLEEVFGY
ncbi:redoxin domain-containing protein [Zhouia spongiae]|uniref:Redoxin domain-containing protein n=1 Tax=Zhouia spongiae TaxID=2202721 RepID=A0ABY3YM59_9FLAO|nr:redoxin domain-containing protein [Zhouia spongiae]UNY98571.1 redoxin domain-containing protein [Zhouia spongiae]